MKTFIKIILGCLLATWCCAEEGKYSQSYDNLFQQETDRRLLELEGASPTVSLTSEVTGILPIANGGTGSNLNGLSDGQLVVYSATQDTIVGVAQGVNGQYLKSNGANSNPSFETVTIPTVPDFGTWASVNYSSEYTATSDGFVCASVVNCTLDMQTPRYTSRIYFADASGTHGSCMPVKNGDTYFLVKGSCSSFSAYFLPIN